MPRNIFWLILIAATLVYVVGLFIPVMDVDAAQYASMSREMLNNHHYLQVLDQGKNYLDKPPLIFWVSVLSFKIFGVSTFAYKLPSFLFTLLGVYSTYRLTNLFYDKQTARLSAVLLYTCEAFFIFNNDVRTDAMLTGAVIFSSWQFFSFYQDKKISNLLLAALGLALGLMAKGPIAAVIVASALGSQIAYKRDWKVLLQWQWYFGIFFALILLIPMLIGLYEQYGWNGPEFFFWTQSFGRITGSNSWKNDAGYFFFTHTFLWAFLPWSLLAVIALISDFTLLIKNRFQDNALTEVFSIGGFVLPFIALSFSHYKLPHYIFVLFPFASILCAGFLSRIMASDKKLIRFLFPAQLTISIILWCAAVFLCSYIFPMTNVFCWLIFFLLLCITIYLLHPGKTNYQKFIFSSAFTMIGVNFLINTQIYPYMLHYQSGSELAKFANAEHISRSNVFFYKYKIYSFEFYFGWVIPTIDEAALQQKINSNEPFWMVGNGELLQKLNEQHITLLKTFSADDFEITLLNIRFLDPKQRQSQLGKRYLIEVK